MKNSFEERRTFGLHELGLLETSEDRALEIILNNTARLLDVQKTAFLVFDDEKGWLISNASTGLGQLQKSSIGLAINGSLASQVREEGTTLAVADIQSQQEIRDSVEARILGIAGYMASPVFGPAGEILGALAAMTDTPRIWIRNDKKSLEESAFLIGQNILLKASFETLRLVNEERKRICNVS